MARALAFFLLIVVLISVVGGVAYQVGIAAAGAAGATGAVAVTAYPYAYPIGFGFFPFFGLLFPFLFLFLIFGLVRAASHGGRGWGHGYSSDRARMFEDWHRAAHERGTAGTAGKGDS
ncbi:MAG: hypothetical protein M3O64_00145 [Chloroflexota bacterium]|nr:hypothetical protein [Chloroflexota bacterium]